MPTTGSDDHGKECPNIFDYATGELSQDAMICWLIRWSVEHAETDEERALKTLGQNFVRAMLSKHNRSLSVEIRAVEILQQDHKIDVLARILDGSGEPHVLLIEDKTENMNRGDQLQRYCEAVRSGKTRLKDVSSFCPIYLKTGNHSLEHVREVESETSSGGPPVYRVFSRQEFLRVLDCYRGDNSLVRQFRSWLGKLEREFNSWSEWKPGERYKWAWASWEGFYRALEEVLAERVSGSGRSETPGMPECGWGKVSNQRGGFLGFWWYPFDRDGNYIFYLQLEVVPDDPSRQKLCFKVKAGDDLRRAADYHELVRLAAEKQRVKIEKPQRMRTGATMTVGWWPGDWLVFNNYGHPDPLHTSYTLLHAQRILEVAAEMDVAPQQDSLESITDQGWMQ